MGKPSSTSLSRRLLALALTWLLALSLVPTWAVAEETGATDSSVAAAAEETTQITATVSVEVAKDDGTTDAILGPVTLTVDEGSNAWDATQQALDAASISYYEYATDYGPYVEWIVSDAYQYDAVTGAYWTFLVNGAYSNVGAGYALQNGDSVTWRYGVSSSATNPTGPDYDTQTEPVETEADWPTFDNNGNVTTADTPTETETDWASLLGGSYATVSQPLIVGDYVYVAVGRGGQYSLQLVRINKTSGAVEAATPLAGNLSYTTRPTYEDGLIYVSLDGGAVQAINPATMKTYWVSPAAADSGQTSTSLKVLEVEAQTGAYDENYAPVTALKDVLFVGTAVFGSTFTATSGSLRGLDALTGTELAGWTYVNDSAGFYWSNVVEVNGYVVAGDTAGVVHVLEGNVLGSDGYTYSAVDKSTIDLGAAVNADIVKVGDVLYVVTHDGVLHQLSVSADGIVSETGKVQAVGYSVAAPTIVGTTAIVVGGDAGYTTSQVAIVDLSTLSVTRVISTADGEAIAWAISSPALVSTSDGITKVYFTANNATGATYWFDLASDTEAHLLYEPEGDMVNYSPSPLVTDSDGALYYLNDSGYLAKLVSKDEEPEPAATTTTTTTGTSDTTTAATPAAKREGIPATGDSAASGMAVVTAAALAAALVAGGVALRRREER